MYFGSQFIYIKIVSPMSANNPRITAAIKTASFRVWGEYNHPATIRRGIKARSAKITIMFTGDSMIISRIDGRLSTIL